MRRFALALVVALIACVAGATAGTAARSLRPASISPEQVKILTCEVRWDARTHRPRLASACAGVRSVAVNRDGHIALTHSSAPVMTIEVTPNEAAVGRGLTAGASGGVSETVLFIHDDRRGRVLNLRRDARRLGTSSGFWLRITHDVRGR